MRTLKLFLIVAVCSGATAVFAEAFPRSLKVYLQHTEEGQTFVRTLTGYDGTPGLIPDAVLVDFEQVLNRLPHRSARRSSGGEFLSLRDRLIQLGKEADFEIDQARRKRPISVGPPKPFPMPSHTEEQADDTSGGVVQIPTDPMGPMRQGVLPGEHRSTPIGNASSTLPSGGRRVTPTTTPLFRAWAGVTDLTKEEREHIRSLFQSSDIPSLLIESDVFIHIPKRAYELARTQLEEILHTESDPAQREVQGRRFVPRLGTTDANWGERMPVWKRLSERMKAYRSFFRSLYMTEGQWRSLVGYYGRMREGARSFSGADLVTLRKVNARLDAISRYHEDELVMLAMSQQDPVIYLRLNALSGAATEQMVSGLMTGAEYLKVRKELVERTGMNSIVVEAENRMLSTLERVRFLAGSEMYSDRGAGLIQTSEQNYEELIRNMRAAEGRKILLRAEMKRVRSLLRETRETAVRQTLRQRLRTLRLQRHREEVLRSRYEGESSQVALRLRKLYEEFVMQYERLDTFANLRVGRVGTVPVRAFELPDPMVPDAGEIEGWSKVYDRALDRSMPKLMWDEVVLFVKTRIGNTRRVIERIDSLTREVKRRWGELPRIIERIETGTRFSETELGQQFRRFRRGLLARAMAFLIKSGIITTVASMGTYAVLPEATQQEVSLCAQSFIADISPHLGIKRDAE